MANKSFTSLKDLELYLQQKINNSLKTEVAETIKDEITSSISEVIYQSGEPLVYERRGGNEFGGMGNSMGTGSLADPETMTSELITDGVIQITPEASRNMDYKFAGVGYDESKSLAQNLIEGYGEKDRWFNKSRDFISDAKENIIQNKSHISSMADGLRRQGLTVVE